MRRFPLRIPKTAHEPGDRLVPMRGCGCVTCKVARENAAIDAHGDRVANLFGIEDHGACPCGRARGTDGRCIASEQCPYAIAEALERAGERSTLSGAADAFDGGFARNH